MVGEVGFEPTTFGFGGRHSIQLSYPPIVAFQGVTAIPNSAVKFIHISIHMGNDEFISNIAPATIYLEE